MADPNNSLLELRGLFNPTLPRSGTVISTNASGASVATQRGVVAATVVPGLTVVTGDEVQLDGSTVVRKLRSTANLPVFNL